MQATFNQWKKLYKHNNLNPQAERVFEDWEEDHNKFIELKEEYTKLKFFFFEVR